MPMGIGLERSNRLSPASFHFNFNQFNDADCLFQFPFRKEDLIRMVKTIGWLNSNKYTRRNRYSVSTFLITCVLLRRRPSPTRWRDMELLFGKNASHLSEIFWSGMECFLDTWECLLCNCMCTPLFRSRLDLYADDFFQKYEGLWNCVASIEGTLIRIARPSGDMDSWLYKMETKGTIL